MTPHEWTLTSPGPRCDECGDVLGAGVIRVSTIEEAEAGSDPGVRVGGFVRRDRCAACAARRAQPPYSAWRGRVADEGAPRPRLDAGLARSFLARLIAEGRPERRALAYLLALLLVRKRALAVVGEAADPSGPRILELRERGSDADESARYRVPVHEPVPDESAAINAELETLLAR